MRALLTLGTLLVVTTVVTGLARTVGIALWGRLHRSPLGRVDAAGGAIVGAVGALLTVWLLAPGPPRLPLPGLTDQIQHSSILRARDDNLSAPPRVFARIGRLLDPFGFPDVFAQFEPEPAPSLPLPADPLVRAAVAAAGPSTVKIEGTGCGGIQEGSGFVVAPGLIMTNAHVVAGIRRPMVFD